MFKRFVWWLPAWVHEAVLWATGWRVVRVVNKAGVASLVWSRKYPLSD